MKALGLLGVEQVGVIDYDDPVAIGDGDALIRIDGLGLCGSDLSRFHGHRPVPSLPWVIGHEGFGVVLEVGAAVDRALVGRTVVLEPIIGCGSCQHCTSGHSAICSERKVIGMTDPGIGREQVVFPATHVHAVPAEWSDATKGSIEPLAVAVKALDLSGIGTRGEALVIGGGPQGLFLSLLLRDRGVTPFLAELNPAKAGFAAGLGIAAASGDSRFDFVFEASGSAGGWDRAVASAASGAAIMLVGMGRAPLEFTSEDFVIRQLRVLTSYVYDHPHGFETAIRAIADGRIDPRRVVSAVYSVSGAAEAYAQAQTAPGKVVVSTREWSESV